ncbi:hypothetical protein HX039_17600 [Myroides marinus]|uniref:hypothetical protein n=1 Tax=Myroides marinus TaxID=703342 RepID=UPI002576B0A1|nr:hypothetical protein [Myroides marinus]MDM1405891.1 hypothetical protein [Myroides marinus]
MKKKIIPLVVLLGTIGAYAQTGIGTPLPHGTAELEISSKDKGVLIPRVELVDQADTNTVKGGVYPESLLVYNTGIGASKIEAGFYFWNKDKWSALVSNSTLYKYIKETAKDGNVTITNTGGNNFTFTWVDKTTDKETSTTLNELIKGMQTVTTLTESSDGIKATLTYKNEEDKAPKVIDLTTLLEGSSEFKDFLKGYITNVSIKETITKIEPGKNADNKNSGTYTYFNEENKEFKITVIDDVNNNFGNIINNEGVKNILNEYLQKGATGNVTYEGGKFYYVKVENGIATKEEIKISELVKANETDTPITRGAANTNGTESGIYNYTSEGKKSITINVVEDVANNFDKVITNNEFKTVFNKYLTDNVEGNVTYKNDKFYYTVKNQDGTFTNKEIELKEIIKENSVLSSLVLTNTANNKDLVKGGFAYKADKTSAANDVEFAETLTSITKGKDKSNNKLIAYDYKDETGNIAVAQITVSADVIDNFNEIIKDNKVITELNNFISGATGSVTVTKKTNGDIVISYKDGNNPAEVNLTTLIAEKETKTTITVGEVAPGGKRTGVYTYKNEDKVDVQITVVDDVTNNFDKIINNEEVQKLITKYVKEKAEGNVIYEGGKFYYVKVENGIATKEEIKISELVKANETDTPITRGAANTNGTESGIYNYTSEGKKSITINVVEDVANNFDKVITNNEFKTVFNKYLTDNVEGNVTYKNDKFYYTVKNQDGTFTNKEIELKEIIKENSVLSSLVLTNTANNKDLVKGGFAYKADKTSAANDVEFAETLTSITKGKDKSNNKLIAYDYKDETGNIAVAQITVSADVIDNFNEIIKDNKVITELNNFISGATGSVTVTKKTNGDIVISYKDGNNPAEVNLTTLIAEKETKTDIKKTNAAGVEVAIDTKPVNGMTFYEYENENKQKRYITVSQDVSDDFSKIVENNKSILETLIKNTGGNASVSKKGDDLIITNVETKEEFNITKLIKDNGAIAELKLVTDVAQNKDSVKAGFTFKADKTTAANDVAFAETLTKITKVQFDMYIYMDVDPNTGEVVEVHVDKPRPNDDGNNPPYDTYQANKFVYENEKGETIDIKGSDLLKTTGGNGSNGSVETLTYLRVQTVNDAQGNPGQYLVYTDEKKQETFISVKDMFSKDETITSLKLDVDKNSLVYTDEVGVPNPISLDNITREPWYVANTKDQATKNNQDIYTSGWVGIGYDKPSSAPNEKLRVNGSITATNSYYADYVFESYFDGYSNLKYDYKFNDLSTVGNFIKTNRHLPGITPISDLEKTDNGYSFNVSELSIQLLEKTEELFLHVIDQQKELNAKETRIEKLESEMTDMTKRLQALEALLTK